MYNGLFWHNTATQSKMKPCLNLFTPCNTATASLAQYISDHVNLKNMLRSIDTVHNNRLVVLPIRLFNPPV